METPLTRKTLMALLASGGKIVAARTFPFPLRYMLNYPGGAAEVSEDQTIDLVEHKLIVGTPEGKGDGAAKYDYVVFRVVDESGVKADALTYYKGGFGRCIACGEIVGLLPKGTAARHGYANGQPPCDGTGKEPEGVVRAAA